MPPTSIGTVRERQRERDTRNALVATIPYYITDNYYHVPGYAGTKANMMALERIRDLEQTITTLIGRVENLRASLREQSVSELPLFIYLFYLFCSTGITDRAG